LEYTTLKQEAKAEFIEKRSRFIGYCKPVSSEEEALAFISAIKSKHWDASHNVYAYSLREGQTFRFSDDGEPQGTAGIPVLDVLRKGGITDAVIVVTRYFGGIMLGAGGLVRAYSHGAAIAVAEGHPVNMLLCALCTLTCDYNQYGRLQALIPQCGGAIENAEFEADIELNFHMQEADFPRFKKELAEATNGSVEFKATGERFFADG
jgi:uncharacterized YigZ family protein